MPSSMGWFRSRRGGWRGGPSAKGISCVGVDEENNGDRRSGGHIFQREVSVIGTDPVRRTGVPGEAAEGVDVAVVHILRIVEMCLFERPRR